MTRETPTGARQIERRTVSRKTPGDGKLEITKVAARRLESLGSEFPLAVDAQRGRGSLGAMPCTCRGDDTPHVHYFVASDLLRSLAVGSEVDLFLDDGETQLFVVTA